jgi:hypothetical protein
MPTTTADGAIERLLAGIEAGAIPDGVFAEDAVLDATVPNWRLKERGAAAVCGQLARWYAHPGRYRSLTRTTLPDGELVEFTLTWTEDDVEHTCHQAHILSVDGDHVVSDTVFCGGRWPAPLVAEMQRAEQEAEAVARP